MSQPEMRSDRLRLELAEVKRQRDLLREALEDALKTAEFEKHLDRPWHRKARAALKATEAKP
jgi:hypothetical protein